MAINRVRVCIPHRSTKLKRCQLLVPVPVNKIDFAVIDRSNICIPLDI